MCNDIYSQDADNFMKDYRKNKHSGSCIYCKNTGITYDACDLGTNGSYCPCNFGLKLKKSESK